MNKTFTLLLMILFYQESFSQVGIGTINPSPSAALEVMSSNSGLLMPRVALTSTADTTTIASPATSLMVYNTNTANDITPGFYYWEGNWKPLKAASGSTSGWSLSGNTITSSDYLGTNNYQPMVIKVNNNQFSKFHPNGGLAIGTNAAAKDDNSLAIGTSANANTNNQATAVGPNTNASGYQSVAMGHNAAASNNNAAALGPGTNASGHQSTALGYGATASNNNTVAIGNGSNVSGYLAMGIGVNSVSSANNSIAFGNEAKASGQQAIGLGYDTNASAQNATAIGYQANAPQANSIILGSSANSSNKVGIGTNTPDERLHIVGSLKIVDGTQANNYVFTSDANGKASWKDPKATIAYGEIYRNSNLTLPSGAINFGTNGLASGMSQNADNIQVQATGIYEVTYTISLRKTSGLTITPEFYMTIYGTEIAGTRTFATVVNGDSRTVSASKLVSLDAYQAVSVYSSMSDPNTNLLANGCTLSVQLVK